MLFATRVARFGACIGAARLTRFALDAASVRRIPQRLLGPADGLLTLLEGILTRGERRVAAVRFIATCIARTTALVHFGCELDVG